MCSLSGFDDLFNSRTINIKSSPLLLLNVFRFFASLFIFYAFPPVSISPLLLVSRETKYINKKIYFFQHFVPPVKALDKGTFNGGGGKWNNLWIAFFGRAVLFNGALSLTV